MCVDRRDRTDLPDWPATELLLKDRQQQKWDDFSWVSTRALLSLFNDTLSRIAKGLVVELRQDWLRSGGDTETSGQLSDTPSDTASDPADWVIDLPGCRGFVIIGDTGEQDASQYVVVPELRRQLADDDIQLVVVCSDVIYPSGDVNDYEDGFWVPYRDLPAKPIFALPGNHDWYDGLSGFMHFWCGRERRPGSVYGPGLAPTPAWFARLLWRRPSRPSRCAAQLPGSAMPNVAGTSQRTPYFALQTEDVLLVCIDTGIDGTIDGQQGEWLLRVSERPGAKLLLTGKPLLVNRLRRPCPIVPAPSEKFQTVLDIVNHEQFHYAGSVGGDVHNLQAYPPNTVDRGHHIVSGGGGAYMSATHQIDEAADNADPNDVVDRVGRMSPEPPQSLSHFTQLMLPRVWRLEVALGLVLVGLGAALVDWPSSTARRTALLGAALALAGLGVARAALAQVPVVRRLRSTPGYTWLLRVVAVALGAMAGMAIHELAGGTGRAAVGFALAAVGFAVACSQALRWTGWWRPLRPSIDPGGSVSPGRRPRPALREVVAPARPSAGQEHPLRILVVGVLLGLGALAGLLLAPWLLWSAAVTLAVWVYGAAVGRRPKRSAPQAIRGSWRTLAAVLSYAILFVDLLIAAGGTMYVPVSLWWPVGAALLELGVVWAAWFAGLYVVITVVAALPFLPAGPDVGAPPWSATRRRRGRIGASAPWLSLMVIVGGCCGAWALTPHLWGARLGPAHDLPPMFVCWVFGVGVVVVLLDFVRRHTGRAYPALVGLTGLVVLGVALWAVLAGRVSDAWWDNGVVRAGIGIVTGTFVGVVAVASGQLALVGAPILALDWRFLTGRDAADLLPVKVATRILNARRTGDGVPAADRVHRRRAEITFPGADQPRGPLQDAIAQIFDSDRPPFFKNFLVCRTTAVELTVVPVLVTGDGPPAIELRPIVVPLPPT